MKKQFQILTATIISIAIVSCSKQAIEKPETSQAVNEEISTTSSSANSRPSVDPLTVDLAGSYLFNGNLKDQTKKLADGVRNPLLRGSTAVYTFDRKGNANSALKFDTKYYVTIANVPVKQNMSLSVWVKRVTFPDQYSGPAIVRHNSTGIALMQDEGGFWASVHSYSDDFATTNIYSGDMADNNWHHIVITYSDEDMALYIDNQLISKTSNIFNINVRSTQYILGYALGLGGTFWNGSIDDLRFYNRTLTASDVQKLYNL
jgi:hypothetical protein